jgi:ATP-dependent Lhr-like helicase
MIKVLNKPFSDDKSLMALNPIIRKWFVSRFKEVTPPQKFSFKLINSGKNVLITAPTGSGKTLSAFIPIISNLLNLADSGELKEEIYCLYISPLRALNNDIYKNLISPINDLYSIEDLIDKKKITIGVRTGDTPQSDRRKQFVHPPNIFVTTPESLAIMLNSPKFIQKFKNLKYVIVDELHEIANSKRGSHLAISLERLVDSVGHDFIRIGLSATIYPLDKAANFLVGTDRDCVAVDASWSKKINAEVFSPSNDLIYTDERKLDNSMYKMINNTIKKNRTTLIFTNTRSGTERLVSNLKTRFGYKDYEISAHHGSLSREERFEVEENLKKGSLKCVVSSTSLELGIDIGSIDNVIQINSPKSITRSLQRIGRSGHSFKDIAKGEIIVNNRDDLVECTVMLYDGLRRKLDAFTMPDAPLDVLAQHIVGMALNKIWDLDLAYKMVKKAYPFRNLDKKDFIALIKYLAGEYVPLRERSVYGKIWFDNDTQKFGKRGRLTRLIYYTNIGTIPDEVAINVYLLGSKRKIGNIEEEFLEKLKKGDVFVLGGKVYKFQRASAADCYVLPANGLKPNIPPWFSEQLPLSYELALDIGAFRKKFSSILNEKNKGSFLYRKSIKEIPLPVKKYLSEFPIDENSKASLYEYIMEQKYFAGFVPSNNMILIEKTIYNDRKYIIFHSLFGRRVNDALSRLFAFIFSDRINEEVGLVINDNGFGITLSKEFSDNEIKSIITEAINLDLKRVIDENIKRTEILRRRFRHAAARGLMILRKYKGHRIRVERQQINAQALLRIIMDMDENFPILKEAYREIENDVMDILHASEILNKIKNSKIKYKIIETNVPSPFSHSLVTMGELDVVATKNKKEYIRKLHKLVMEKIERRKDDNK